MATPVTVDSDDLQTLLYATAAIKAVENALKAQAKDPLAEQAQAGYSEAHQRVTAAWQGAVRRKIMPQLFRSPTVEEVSTLREMFDDPHEPDGVCVRAVLIPPSFLQTHRSLMSIGLIEIGTERSMIVWSCAERPTAGPSVDRQFARLTERGFEALRGSA